MLAGAADIDTAFSVRDTAADAGEADCEGTRGTKDCIDLDDMFGETLRVSAEPPRGTSGSRGGSTAFGEDATCPAGFAGMAGGGLRPAATSPGSPTAPAPMPAVTAFDRVRSEPSDGPADGLIDGLGLIITGEEVEEELERGSVKVDVVLLPLLRMTGFLATAGFAGAGRVVEAAAGAVTLDTFSNAAIRLLMSFGAASAASASLSLLAIAILPLGGCMNAVQIGGGRVRVSTSAFETCRCECTFDVLGLAGNPISLSRRAVSLWRSPKPLLSSLCSLFRSKQARQGKARQAAKQGQTA